MDKEKYKERLHTLVMELKSQDPELLEFLRSEIDSSLPPSRIDKIEKYLGLDYKLDTINPDNTLFKEIDYSFISDQALRDQLISDFREMMRYRYGTRSHKADFMEFCKYAHFQLEGLVNYFMEAWSLDDDDNVSIEIAKENILENWPKTMTKKPIFRDEVKSVNDIDYFQKVTAIISFLEINSTVVSRIQHCIPCLTEKVFIVNYLGEVISYIRRTRNELNHRGKVKTKNIDALIEQFETQKKPQKDTIGNWVYQFTSQNDKDVKYYMWYKYTPWEDVIRTIHLLESAASEAFKTEY